MAVRSSTLRSPASHCYYLCLRRPPYYLALLHCDYTLMARFSFIGLVALAAAGFVAASPAQESLQTSLSDRWSWDDCGMPLGNPFSQVHKLMIMHPSGESSDPVHIKSIEISPDPPKPGANMTVKVVGQADELIEVCTSR